MKNDPCRTFHGALFWKFYFYGLGLLLAVATGAGIVGHLVGKIPPWMGAPERLVGVLQGWFAQAENQPGELPRRVAEIAAILDLEIAVFDEG